MDDFIFNKLNELLNRYNFLEKKILDINIINDNFAYLEVKKEYESLKYIISIYLKYKELCNNLIATKTMLEDEEIKDLVLEELKNLEISKNEINKKILDYFDNKTTDIEDINCKNIIFLEIRAATGGSESAIFVEDLFSMYSNYFNFSKCKLEIMSYNAGNYGGFKDIISRVIGFNLFDKMKNESGIHRVQRVPKTESRGRIHTSTCTVAVLPELEIIDNIKIDFSELRIDTYRSSGAGGQHVNTTDSAVRITHKPSGIMAECQDERSQHKNKQKALSLLKSRLLLSEQIKQKSEIDFYRKSLIGMGYRSEKIRTYNYISNRLTDHRFNITLYKLNEIMDGKLWLLLDNLK